MSENYYVILGVPFDASGDDIKTAFRRRALQLHPDTSGMEIRILEIRRKLECRIPKRALSGPASVQPGWWSDRTPAPMGKRRRAAAVQDAGANDG